MIKATSTATVEASPQEVLELVLNLEAYRLVDQKIRKIYDNPPISDSGQGTVVFRASIRGLPGPRQREKVVLDRWHSLTFTSDGPWLADRMLDITGSFRTEPLDDGRSQVTHEYELRFKGPLRWVLEWYSRAWLERDLESELERLRQHFSGRRDESDSPLGSEGCPCTSR